MNTNKEIVGRWFKAVWTKDYDTEVIDELASSDMVMQYFLYQQTTQLFDLA